MVDELYDLIGGRQTVWAATDSFYRRVLADARLSHFFKSSDMAHLRAGQSMFISMLLGGRVVYFDAFLNHFRAALEEVGVKADKAEKVMKLLEGKRGAVLNR